MFFNKVTTLEDLDKEYNKIKNNIEKEYEITKKLLSGEKSLLDSKPVVHYLNPEAITKMVMAIPQEGDPNELVLTSGGVVRL